MVVTLSGAVGPGGRDSKGQNSAYGSLRRFSSRLMVVPVRQPLLISL
jgi:hypothetical protein